MRLRDRVSYCATLIALALAVLAIGGSSRWAIVTLVVIGAIGVGSQVRSRRRLGKLSPLVLFIAIALGLTALQLVPLPDGLVDRISPTGQALRVDGQELLGTPSSWSPISLDPAQTLVELAKLGAYLLLALTALRITATESGRVRLLSAVAGIAVATALAGALHYLVGATKLFGFYEPSYAHPSLLTPLLNPNHLASLMTLGAIIAGGLAIHERRAPPVRVLWIFASLICIGVELWTRSRGGTLALAAGVTTTTIVLVLQRLMTGHQKTRADAMRVAIPGAIVLLCSLVLVVYFGGAEVRDELESTRLSELQDARSKYAAWSSAWTLVEETPYLGIGRGAFESTFTRVHPAAGSVTFSHLENEYMQVLVDWGLIGAGALAGAALFGLLSLRRRWKAGPLVATAIGGLVALGVHSVVDFGLEIPGLAVPAVLVAATLFYVPLEESDQRSARRITTRLVVIVALLVTGVLAALPIARTLDEDHEAFRETASLADAKAALERHPLDYLSAAQISLLSSDAAARIAFLNLAMRLHPSHPGLHRIAARLLLVSGRPQQAALELRLAISGTEKPELLVADVLRAFPDAPHAIEALPGDHPRWSRIATTLTEAKRDDVALAYLWKVIEVSKHPDPEIVRRALYAATKLGDKPSALRAARYLLQLEPTSQAVIDLAKIQIGTKDYVAAAATLDPLVKATVTSPEHITAHSLYCDVQIARVEWTAARECLTQTLQLPGLTLAMRRTIHARMAVVEDALGNKDRARTERELAGGHPER